LFLKLLYPLVKYFTFFNIFQYITFRAAYAALTALALALLCGPWLIRRLKAWNLGESIRSDGPKSHQAKSGTPTMGGILILGSLLASSLLWMDLGNLYTRLVLLATAGFGAVGFMDDYLKKFRKGSRGLTAGLKFSAQIALSLGIVLLLYFNRGEHTTLLYIPFFKKAVVDLGWLYIPFATLLLVGYSNGVNLTDGLDGLAIGLVIMVGLTLAVLTYLTGRADYAAYLQIPFVKGSWDLAVYSLALVGSSVGFLWFNSHPAELMMGDTGSLALGGVIGVISLAIKKEILLFLLGGVFVLEVLSVAIQVASFQLTGKRVFKMAPLHHHFELLGWPESKVVTRFWILGGLFAILGLSTLKIQ
jgi:phospho-N-acetylmuramoyl-pentapeptide-transferase